MFNRVDSGGSFFGEFLSFGSVHSSSGRVNSRIGAARAGVNGAPPIQIKHKMKDIPALGEHLSHPTEKNYKEILTQVGVFYSTNADSLDKSRAKTPEIKKKFKKFLSENKNVDRGKILHVAVRLANEESDLGANRAGAGFIKSLASESTGTKT